MAIFASNPTSAAVSTLSGDALEPSVLMPKEGFTEELAAAMQHPASLSEESARPSARSLEETAKKPSDLQILPAEVLLNAVGDANFALNAQVNASTLPATNAQPLSPLMIKTEAIEENLESPDLANQLQGAELAAANLAAQMSATVASLPLRNVSNSGETAAGLSVSATSGASQETSQSATATAMGLSLPTGSQAQSILDLPPTQKTAAVPSESINSPSLTAQPAPQSLEVNTLPDNQAARMGPIDTGRAQIETPAPSVSNGGLTKLDAPSSNILSQGGVSQENGIHQIVNLTPSLEQGESQLSLKRSSSLLNDPNLVTGNVSNTTVSLISPQNTAFASSLEPLSESNLTSAVITKTTSITNASISPSSLNPLAGTTNLDTEKALVSSKTGVETQIPSTEETAFNFDAKLTKLNGSQNPMATETPINIAVDQKLAKSEVQKSAVAIEAAVNMTAEKFAKSEVQQSAKSIEMAVSSASVENLAAPQVQQSVKVIEMAGHIALVESLTKSDVQQSVKAVEAAVTSATLEKTTVQIQNTKDVINTQEQSVQRPFSQQVSTSSPSVSSEKEVVIDSKVSSTFAQNKDTSTSTSTSTSTPASASASASAQTSNFNNVRSGIQADRTGDSLPAMANAAPASNSPTNRLDQPAPSISLAGTALPTEEAFRTEVAQSLEDLSSSFVSSLVGGPQRPVNTVMDFISMRTQELPAPVVPHEVRLDSGAVQLEIQKMVKQGGGHVVMELTPPDQSKFTIELKLDERGGALLIVEGVSDSTKTRLEQSAPQLREQFQQMGLELQLDMRQQGRSPTSSAADFSGSQERGSGANDVPNNGAGDTAKNLTQREAGAIRARETGANQVYLYA
jgi:hypothetical protein